MQGFTPRYFHLFNRGVDKRVIFLDDHDRLRFLETVLISHLSRSTRLSLYKRQFKLGVVPDLLTPSIIDKFGPPLVKILCFCLMPNHFHLEIKELMEGGMIKFVKRLGNGYTKFFNTKYERKGRLFEFHCQAVEVETDEQLIHLSRYIHINPSNSSLKITLNENQLRHYQWSSLPIYLGDNSPWANLVGTEEILGFFKSRDDYWDFVKAGINKSDYTLSNELLIDV